MKSWDEPTVKYSFCVIKILCWFKCIFMAWWKQVCFDPVLAFTAPTKLHMLLQSKRKADSRLIGQEVDGFSPNLNLVLNQRACAVQVWLNKIQQNVNMIKKNDEQQIKARNLSESIRICSNLPVACLLTHDQFDIIYINAFDWVLITCKRIQQLYQKQSHHCLKPFPAIPRASMFWCTQMYK